MQEVQLAIGVDCLVVRDIRLPVRLAGATELNLECVGEEQQIDDVGSALRSVGAAAVGRQRLLEVLFRCTKWL